MSKQTFYRGKHMLLALMFALLATLPAAAGSSVKYAKLTAKASGEGKVYVSTTEKDVSTITDTEWSTESTATGQSASVNGAGTVNFWLYAQGAPEGAEVLWLKDGNTVAKGNGAQYSITSESGSCAIVRGRLSRRSAHTGTGYRYT